MNLNILDIDECSFYQNLCGNNGECVNTLGSYSCKCKRGFEHKDGECTKGKPLIYYNKVFITFSPFTSFDSIC